MSLKLTSISISLATYIEIRLMASISYVDWVKN